MPISWRRGIYYSNDVIEKYNTIIQKFCREKSIPFLELKDILGIKDLDDGLHPNSQGHAKIFRKVKQFLIDEKIV
ncbi:SGNH/GDSL hydrolase family protein [Candidatus Woesearchaeota archaeon]|nr:SGNH/GDSL hydrolase family protein [Candidatus Woesearchaeota archaeon]